MYLDPKTNTKICSNPNCHLAGKPQPADNFPSNKHCKDGKSIYCRECLRIRRKKLRENPEWVEKKRQVDRIYREENKEKKANRDREYRLSYAKYDTYFEKLSIFEEIRVDPNNSQLIQVRCALPSCSSWFNPTNQQVRMRINTFDGKSLGWSRFFCGDQCKQLCTDFGQKKYPKGFKHHISKKWQKELAEIVFDRDEYTCCRCGGSPSINPDLKLHCHHIIPIVCNPVESADIDNCITLCETCHNWIHNNIPKCDYGSLVHLHYKNKHLMESRVR